MIVNLKALVVVLGVSVPVLFFFLRPFSEQIGAKRYMVWATYWLATAVAAYVSPGYWLFIAGFSVLLFFFSRAESNKSAAFLFLLISVPAYGLSIPGFMGINRFIETNPQVFMIAILLLPALFARRHMKKISRAGGATDFFVLAWLILQLAFVSRMPTLTHMLRVGVETFLAIAPIYYVLSRQPKTFQDMRVATAAFVLAGIILCAITIPETAMGWHYYTGIAGTWVGDIFFAYKVREGVLRATGSSVNPIVWGFLAMCVFGFALAVLNDRVSRLYKYTGFILIMIGLLASLSRGPWVGAAAMVIVFAATGPQKMKRLVQLGFGGLLAMSVAAATPYGQRIIGLLPFIGDSASDTISYRQQLLKTAREVIAERPLFGTHDFLSHPKLQPLRQGEGIIDIVNSYIGVALQSGYVGLTLFLGVFLTTLIGLRSAMRSAYKYDPQLALYCRAYLATLAGVMVTIFTTSTVEHMSYVIWAIIAGAVALIRIERHQRDHQTESVATEAAPAPKKQAQFDWK